jgi:hypothetical protein
MAVIWALATWEDAEQTEIKARLTLLEQKTTVEYVQATVGDSK